MSIAAPARVSRRPRPQVAPARPSLRLVAARPLTVGRLPFVLLVGGILASGLVVLLMLHTLAAQDAFRLHDLQAEQGALTDTQEELSLALQQQESPRALAARARALGMVATGSIAFVEVRKHGKIVGVVEPAPPPAPPAPEPTASATKPAVHGATDGEGASGGTDTTQAQEKPRGHRRADRPAGG